MIRLLLSSVFILLQLSYAFCQDNFSIQRVEPMNWWVGMKTSNVQLIIYGKNLGKSTVKIQKEGLTLLKTHTVENSNYLFLDVAIEADATAGFYPIEFYVNNKLVGRYNYELKNRDASAVKAQGVHAEDLIYLIMPDRFANGNKKNDQVKGLREMNVDRDSMYARHGGDLEGIIQHLDYLNDLGVTSVWLTPVLTNDMPQASYHGYANTENYQVDPRFGTNETYRKLGEELHKRKMKLVHDVVPNHVGLYHWTVIDKPFKDWLHEWPSFTQTTYRDQTIFDPYAATVDREKMEKGWFVETMPDMNQQNEYVQKYILQSHIWWIEYAGIDGFRIDTYPYNDLAFMAKWTTAIKNEYPNFSFFGETWVQSVPNQAYFLGGQRVGQSIDTKLDGVTDFQLNYAIGDALNNEQANRLYATLGSDYQYPNPLANVIFLDNHDKDRFFSVVEENLEKYKSAFSWLLTSRGIPQMYYGAEVLMKNFNKPDGLLREDFKGGFEGDTVNKFSTVGRSDSENELFNHVKKLANYRKNNTVLQYGTTQHYVPENNVYVYFRSNETQVVSVFMNCNAKEITLSLPRYQESLKGAKRMKNILTDVEQDIPLEITLKPHQTLVFELKK
ncbi:glycoside hydrolase family 13 protein [Sphingobacterium sp. SRCM116780]|uniref:glycoside hydrolase family 13 protein n=1 Tax=Sphingobacterium sp. SRCM116780 TaxID=2907623 RepID=UPI001F160259|nr:glycoside hydrolase family 13 protein [Sphingobacterium sp. SRCM116780]UIR56409.1 glycoside hydrolase family 13 protein [Sphingobacterium sp. SRCM116780]